MLSEQNKVSVNIEDEMRKSYMDYAMSVIVGRALPDVRDGLKPVHRRVLFAMSELGNEWNKAYKKSARVVGDVIGKYHPHGDTAVYDTIVRMAQDFSMRYQLVDGQGNFGSIDGDSAAAMRYTEVRMARLAGELLADIDKETVDFGPNYDDSLTEPLVLPCKFPNLLVNGSEGIAVGMATKIPPHNLGEVIDALMAIIDDPTLDFEELLQRIPGPDFPTAGFILGREGIREAYANGRGIIQMRARALVETQKKTERQAIVVTEIPFQVNKARLIEKIADLVKEKKIEGISDLRDESDREGMRIVIELKRDAIPQVILNQLYKMTQMQTSFGIIMLAIVGGQPRVLTLREVLDRFLDHRKEIVTRRCIFELKKAEARAHILEGLKIALENLDEVIQIIKTSANSPEAKERLMNRFSFSELQAQAILDMRLHRLTGLERDKIIAEYNEILALIARLKEILASEVEIFKIIRGELEEIRERFADVRRTEIIAKTGDLSLEDLIVEEDMVVTVSHSGYIKRNAVSLYRAQRRGGKGKTGMRPKEEDFVERLFIASTHSYILIFTDQGKVYWLKVHEIPSGGPGQPRQGDRQPAAARRWRAGHDHPPGQGVRGGEIHHHRDPERHHQEDRADGLFQPPGRRYHRPDHRRGGPADCRPPHRRRNGYPAGQQERQVDPLTGDRRATDGAHRPRRAGDGPGRGRPGDRHGDGDRCHRRDSGHGHRERLRQAHRPRRIPGAEPRRQGDHHHQDLRAQRPGGRYQAMRRGFRPDVHHRSGQGPAYRRRRSLDHRPQHPGGTADGPGGGGTHRRRRQAGRKG